MTSCSVGYGDVTPKTFIGKCLACLTALIGIVGTSIPTTFMSQSFRRFKRNQKIKSMLLRQKQNLVNNEILKDCRISEECIIKRL